MDQRSCAMCPFDTPATRHYEGKSNAEGRKLPMPLKTSTVGYRARKVRAAAIESGTGSNVTDYVAADGSNSVAVTTEVADVAAIKSMLELPPPRSWPRCKITASFHR